MAQKIVENLVLGDRHSAPKDSELIISVAEEIFDQVAPHDINSNKYIKDSKHVYYNFEDYPNYKSMDKELIYDAVKTIENNIKDKKVYVHCVWGINRSASTVFIYLVRNNLLKSNNVHDAMREFKNFYNPFGPNPGWREFLIKEYPYND